MKHLTNIIDLHGVKHQWVEEVLERNLLGYHNIKGWVIITGNSPLMIEIVESWLDRYRIPYYRENHNYGRIILVE